ncbi:tRNA 2-selenouridine(34) synthase MnmH [Janthinobacterium sp. PC23-8]|uniref:tRNA 2-selenouridine(34) synthase MnmH n=1 Tax=Janthinobacterium sp. PC23-8 TaxID=2012679 RepID=UPI000B97BC1F|nr:tRNA 2-selenouridine(34) synthase MnmH [Janthinobacterium sp. PC23-8]OYO28808.1 tRNA 2-selenouridine(34) synthase MnmH [Janthinobacterium sp. PC23-8]
MKYPAVLPFAEILPQLGQFDAIIDVRSPSEFAEDHLPGAINLPVLDDEERIKVGTLYKQTSAFEAKKVGAALIAKNIAHHIETHFLGHPQAWKPLVYCWRGGNRSGAMAHILARIGWPVIQLDGGYKEYRRHVNAELATLPGAFHFINVLCGPTGSGKSRLLQVLDRQGAQVIDLEQLAAHRGSVLGGLPEANQPSQKAFESGLWRQLRHFDAGKPVFIESESKKVGRLRVPDALMDKMRAADCTNVQLSTSDRVQLLMEDYAHFVGDPEKLNVQLALLTQLHGREKIAHWQQLALAGRMTELVEELLVQHYDPGYLQSIRRNFSRYQQAAALVLPDISDAAFEQAARGLCAIVSTNTNNTPISRN